MLFNLIKVLKEKMSSGLGKDIAITLLSQVAIMILALIINKLLSVKLGVEGYGHYSIIKKNASVISYVLLSGMGIALPRYFSGYLAQEDFKRAKSTVLASLLIVLMICLVVFGTGSLMTKQISPFLVGNSDYFLYYTSLFFAVSITLSSFLFAYYRGANAFVKFAISQVTIQVLIIIGALFFGHNLVMVLNLWSVTTILYVGVAIITEYKRNNLYQEHALRWKENILPQLKTLFKYGMPRMVGDFFLFAFAAFPLVFINQKIGIRASSFFATGITLTAIITPLFSFLGMVLLPYVSTSIAQNNFKQADQLIKKLTVVYIILSVLSIIVLWVGMELCIQLFFSAEFLPSAPVSRIILLSIIFEAIYLLLRNPIDAISDFPYNTLNLIVSFAGLILLFAFSETLEDFAVSFLLITALKSLISYFTWQWCRKVHQKQTIIAG